MLSSAKLVQVIRTENGLISTVSSIEETYRSIFRKLLVPIDGSNSLISRMLHVVMIHEIEVSWLKEGMMRERSGLGEGEYAFQG